MEQRSRPAAHLAQCAHGGLVLLSNFAAATGRGQVAYQQCPPRLVIRVGANQLARIGQGLLRCGRETLGQGAENLRLQFARVLAQSQQPCMELATRRQVEIGQQWSAEGGCGANQLAGHRSLGAGAGLRGKEVDVERLGQQFDGLSVCNQPGICRIVDEGPDLAEAPAQSPARIVRHVPEYLAQPLAPVLVAGQREVGEQSTCLARGRQRHRGAVADHFEFAEDPELQHVASSAATRRTADPPCRLCGNHASTATFHADSHAGAHGLGRLSDR